MNKRTARNIALGALFVAVAAFAVIMLSMLFTPYQSGLHAKETVRGSYSVPNNSIEVAFFGTSSVLSGFSPDTLYEDFGIASYNYATSAQPMLVSYYLLQDALRSQESSLKTVVIDPSIVMLGEEEEEGQDDSGLAEIAIRNMKLSPVKLEALIDLVREYDIDPVGLAIPALRFHSRWSELTKNDYTLPGDVGDSTFSHGQYIRFRSNIESEETAKRTSNKNKKITKTIDADPEELEARWDSYNLRYLDKLMELCEARGIRVIFAKVPRNSWDDVSHDCIQLLADRCGVDFIDLCLPEILDSCDLSYAYDYVDTKHPNIRGSQKITRYLGKRLSEDYGVRPESSTVSGFEDWQLERYGECLKDAQLVLCDDFEDYLDLIRCRRYVTFIAVRGDAAAGMSDATKRKLQMLGLGNLADLHEGEAYVGIMENGTAAYGTRSKERGVVAKAYGQFKDGRLKRGNTNMQPNAKLPGTFKLESGGAKSWNHANIYYDEVDYSENGVGINFAVFDKESGELLDTSCFNTSDKMQRTSDRG